MLGAFVMPGYTDLVPKPVEITLLAKPGCHLCDDARAVIEGVRSSVSQRITTSLTEVNILGDPKLARLHSEDIPVVLVNGRQHAIWRVDEQRLTTAIEKAAARRFGRRPRALPAVQAQHTSRPAIADGGIETALEARLGQQLPEFAAFVLLDTEEGREALTEYYRPFIELAFTEQLPLVLDTPTWRANPDWGAVVGYDAAALDAANRHAARLTRAVAEQLAPALDLTVGGCVGPRYEDDGVTTMTANESEKYHSPQVRALVSAGADRVTAVTMTDAGEAEGIVRAARAAGAPVVVSFAVGEDGRLPGEATLAEVILAVDEATDSYPDGYFVNCAHPSEAARALLTDGQEVTLRESRALSERVIGFRLNAARHGDDGPGDSPAAFAQEMLELRALAPAASTFGGCCGTDYPHIAALAARLR